MMQFTARLRAVAGRANEMVEALQMLKRTARRVDGCSATHIAADTDCANTFWYSEDWVDIQALEREFQSDRFSQLLALMETCVEPPIVEFRLVAETRGLEYIAAVRETPAPEAL
jgi:quinol monooxygenase YgiN